MSAAADAGQAAAPYEALAELAERELLIASCGDPERVGELADVARERAAIVAALPDVPPAAAEPALVRAAATQARTTTQLALRAAEVRTALAEVERGRRTARGYGMGGVARPTLDRAG